ncbi:iron-siderophore ABC transporter substrate-binding protein [Leptolyngbya sp. NK1-12]|nr:iron-siderophore ABC transporter substrate-binding protein [Leptolyngbya sp. NK1-12]
MGETCIPRSPQRLILLGKDTLANSLALGVKPIGSVFTPNDPLPSYLQNKVDGIESVGEFNTPSIEKILRLKPDLILANSYYTQQNTYKQLSRIAPTVVLNVPYPPPSWKEQLEELAQVLGKEKVAQQFINNYWQRIEKLQQTLGDRRYTLTISIAGADSYDLWIQGENYLSAEVLRDVGLQRPQAQRGDFLYINASEEKISMLDGDILFFVTRSTVEDLQAIEKLKQKPLWQRLNVVQRNQVYFVGVHWSNPDIFAINAVLDDLEKYLVNSP